MSQATSKQRSIFTYGTHDGMVLVFDDHRVMLSVDGKEYFQAGVSVQGDTYMHIHVPGLDILRAVLGRSAKADRYVLRGVDNLFEGLSRRPFERTDESTFTGQYTPLPDFVPMAAFLARLPNATGEYLLAVQKLYTREWSIFLLEGDLYATGAIGTMQEVPNIGAAGSYAIGFSLYGHRYYLTGDQFGPPQYLCDDKAIDVIDVRQFCITLTRPGFGVVDVRLTPLYARR